MPRLFGRKKHHDKHEKPGKATPISPTHQHITILGADKKHHVSPSSSSSLLTAESTSPSPTSSSQDLIGSIAYTQTRLNREPGSGKKVAQHTAFFEDLNIRTSTGSPGSQSPRRMASPEKKKRDRDDSITSTHAVSIAVTSPPGGNRTPSFPNRYSRPMLDYMGNSTPTGNRVSMSFENSGTNTTEIGKEKTFENVDMPLPPLQTTAMRLREVDARRNAQGGGFGFILRKSYLPMPDEPDKTKLVHLIEPRSDYFGPLMTGDRIIEVNGEMVEDAPHEQVVEMIKASGDCVNFKVASMPELVELNNRGAFDTNPSSSNPFERNTGFRKSGKAKQGTGRIGSGSGSLTLILALYTGTLRRGKVKGEFKVCVQGMHA